MKKLHSNNAMGKNVERERLDVPQWLLEIYEKTGVISK